MPSIKNITYYVFSHSHKSARLAQSAERGANNATVAGSIPASSNRFSGENPGSRRFKTSADTVIVLDPSWSLADEQSINRVHRIEELKDIFNLGDTNDSELLRKYEISLGNDLFSKEMAEHFVFLKSIQQVIGICEHPKIHQQQQQQHHQQHQQQ
ncbi:hypothetical protein ACTA71_010000 [Dictyostelium dimigraforme]